MWKFKLWLALFLNIFRYHSSILLNLIIVLAVDILNNFRCHTRLIFEENKRGVKRNEKYSLIHLGPHFLCWISGVVPFNTWLISNWEDNNCCYKLSKCTKWHLFHSISSKLSFWVKIVVILSVAQLCNNIYLLLSLR